MQDKMRSCAMATSEQRQLSRIGFDFGLRLGFGLRFGWWRRIGHSRQQPVEVIDVVGNARKRVSRLLFGRSFDRLGP